MQIDNQLPELEAEIDFMRIQHRSADAVLYEARDLYSRWDLMEFEDKRTIVEIITDVIRVGKEDIHIKLSYLLTKNANANTRGASAPLTTWTNQKNEINNQLNPVKRQHGL
jgi:hypothetical protein